MKKILIAWLFAMLAFTSISLALESDYAKPFCESVSGIHQFRTSDGTYVDCLTADTAWEVEFADTWYECIGQAFYYAAVTGRKPGCALITNGTTDQRFINRFLATIQYWRWCINITFIKMV